MGELLDSGTLDGMLDTDVTSIVHPSRPDHRQPRSPCSQLLAHTYTLGLIYSVWSEAPPLPPRSGCLLDAVHTIEHASPADSFPTYIPVHAVHFSCGSVSKAAEHAVLHLLFCLGETMKGQPVMVRCCPSRSFQNLQVGCDGDSRLGGHQQRCGQPGLAGSDAAQDTHLHHPAP